MVAPAAVLAVLGLAVAVVPSWGEGLLAPHADLHPGEAGHLVLWAGLTPALGLSALILTGGALLFVARATVERWQERHELGLDADRAYRRSMRRLDDVAADVTALTQRGSLPVYLGTILLVLVTLVGGALLRDGLPPVDQVRAWDTPAQVVGGALAAGSMILAARARRRLKAVVLAGVSGYAVAGLFLLHGAPDLALTQVLVETVTLVVFVLVLRRLPPYFSVRPLAGSRWVRLGVGVLVGVTVGFLAVLIPAARVAEPVSVDFAEEAYVFGGGRNIVNVTLVDIRAWDTMGELAVLLVAATGIASLVFLSRRGGELPSTEDAVRLGSVVWADHPDPMAALRGTPDQVTSVRAGRHREWLRGSRTVAPRRRSVLFETATRVLFHTMIVVAVFLLFSGHNAPGGGFAAGLVTGIALTIRYLAGGPYELREAAPVHPGLLLGAGLFLSAGVGLVALLAGGAMLQSVIIELTVPLLGDVKLVTSLFFDMGVYLVVVGLVLDILRSLGAEIDRQGDGAATVAPAPATTTAEVTR